MVFMQSVADQSYSIQATRKGSDQTARMRRLIWAFAGRTYHIVGNLMSRLKYFYGEKQKLWKTAIFRCKIILSKEIHVQWDRQTDGQLQYLLYFSNWVSKSYSSILFSKYSNSRKKLLHLTRNFILKIFTHKNYYIQQSTNISLSFFIPFIKYLILFTRGSYIRACLIFHNRIKFVEWTEKVHPYFEQN